MLANSTRELIHSTLPCLRDSNTSHSQISHINRHNIKGQLAPIQLQYLSNTGHLTTASVPLPHQELLWHLHLRHLLSK